MADPEDPDVGLLAAVDDQLFSCVHPLVSLERLILAGCHRITNTGVSHLAAKCPNLIELSLYQCALCTDLSLKSIADALTELRVLNVRSCALITDDGLKELSRCRFLSKVCLENTGITGAIASHHLIIIQLRMAADDGMMQLLASHPHLELIESNCCIVDDLWPGYSTMFYLDADDTSEEKRV